MTEEKPDYIVASFSGGKDSTAMVLRMIELGEHIDEVVNLDTYMEFPAMYEHIEKVKKIVEEAGIKYTTVRAEHDYLWYMMEKPIPSKEFGMHYGYGWASVKARWCLRHLKLDPMDAYFKELAKTKNIIKCVGLASDEVRRLERKNNQQANHRHPLVDWGWTEADCLKYCYDRGFDWGGLYRDFGRVSCWCCPLSSLDNLRVLWHKYPELWSKLEEWETKMNQPEIGRFAFSFREDTSVFDLRARFELEDERIAKGLSITSTQFYRELRAKTNELPSNQTKIEDLI